MELVILYTILAVAVGLGFALLWALLKAKERSAEEQALLLPYHHPRIGPWLQRGWFLLGITWLFDLIFDPQSVIHFLSLGFRPPRPVSLAMDFLSHFAIFGLSSAYAHWHLKQILTTKNKGPGMFKLHAIFGFAALFVLAIYVTKATTDKWKSPPSTPAANS